MNCEASNSIFTAWSNLKLSCLRQQLGQSRYCSRLLTPLFENHGKGAYISIKISGNKDHPAFKLDVRKVF